MSNYWMFLVYYLLVYGCAHVVVRVIVVVWWKPRRLEKEFASQGIRGPKYKLFFGNVKEMVGLMQKEASQTSPSSDQLQNPHHILPRVLSFYSHWRRIYGSTFVIWFGPTARVVVDEPELVREILVSNSGLYDKYESHPLVRQLEGDGLLSLTGEKWAHHRKIITPAFHMDNLKLLVPKISESVVNMLEKWEWSSEKVEIEINVSEWFQCVAEDALTRTVFGSSYEDGRLIFQLQAKQMLYASEAFQNIVIPGYRFVPTKKNVESWRIEREIRRALMSLIRARKEINSGIGLGKQDLLGILIEASVDEFNSFTVDDIIEECKTFLFAGKHTTSNLLTWTVILLGMYPDWQNLAREEVIRVCGSHDPPTRDHVTKLKMLEMILKETLRMYPPVVANIRKTKADVVLGGGHKHYKLPKDTEILLPILALHHDQRLWGADAQEFNPGRFKEGILAATAHSAAFMPFGVGVRACVGQNLAMVEAKIAMAILLQRFTFRVSSSYIHAPTIQMLLQPQFGAPIIFTPLSNNY